MKKALNITLSVIVGSALISACTAGGNNPGIEYAPDMYVSKGYESMTQLEEKPHPYNEGGSNVRVPAKGTVARGQSDYVYPYTADQYEQASQELRNPVENTPEVRAEGKRLFETFCDHCHGADGNNGPIFTAGKVAPPAWGTFNSDLFRAITEGAMYHTITYGKGNMGSHATQLNPTQRWTIIKYLRSLAYEGMDEPVIEEITEASDSTNNEG